MQGSPPQGPLRSKAWLAAVVRQGLLPLESWPRPPAELQGAGSRLQGRGAAGGEGARGAGASAGGEASTVGAGQKRSRDEAGKGPGSKGGAAPPADGGGDQLKADRPLATS